METDGNRVYQRSYGRIGLLIMLLGLCFLPSMDVRAAQKMVIALDPGHGGEESGACYYGNMEKDVNWSLACMVKQQLEAYDGVTVLLTREQEETLDLKTRAERAAKGGADLLVSLHCNASETHKSNGASVYISTGAANLDTLQQLSDCFLGQFEALGLSNAGTFARITQTGGRREDGSFQDYYGILRYGYNYGIPALIVEHCYLDATEDIDYVKDTQGLCRLAMADANALASFYGWKGADGKTVEAKHAKVYGGTTKAVELGYYEPPRLTAIRILESSVITPSLVSYEVTVEDGAGISSLYLVYSNGDGATETVTLTLPEEMTTGTYELKGYIPENMQLTGYTLSYVGLYNAAGYDAGYKQWAGQLVGYGKCQWLNAFSYDGEADIQVSQKGSISTAHARLIDYEIQLGLRSRHNYYSVSYYPY